MGFSPILLITWHNWHFGGQFVPLTSAAFVPTNLMTPPSTYLAAFGEMLRLDFSGNAVRHVLRQLWNWNHVGDFYRLIPLFTVFWVLFSRSYTIPLTGLVAVALSLQAVLLFYVPSGRYAYLAWGGLIRRACRGSGACPWCEACATLSPLHAGLDARALSPGVAI